MARQARVVTRRRTTCRLHRSTTPPILPNPTRAGPAPAPPTKQAGATARARQPSAAMVDYSKFNNLDISDDDEANENEKQQQPKMITPLFADPEPKKFQVSTDTDKQSVVFTRVPTQYIAALGDPDAYEGTGANGWGLWANDPKSSAIHIDDYDNIDEDTGKTPAGWTFDRSCWWLSESALLMPNPVPLPPGMYHVTGGKETAALLIVEPSGRWRLNGARLRDVRSSERDPASCGRLGSRSVIAPRAGEAPFLLHRAVHARGKGRLARKRARPAPPTVFGRF